jgi:hypothetical protein
MKIPCDIIKDLIPLYNDDVCSSESKKAVELHIKSCDSCMKTYQMQTSNTIYIEASDMLKDIKPFKKVKRKLYRSLLFIATTLVLISVISVSYAYTQLKDNVKIHHLYPELSQLLARDNRNAGPNDLLVSYDVENERLFYVFSNDQVRMSLPADGTNIYIVEKDGKKAQFEWLNTYTPGEKPWLKAQHIDVTGNGQKELCVSLYIASGTGVSISGLHIVDLETMTEIELLDPNHIGTLKKEDAIIIQQTFQQELNHLQKFSHYESLTQWAIMGFEISEQGEIEVRLGVSDETNPGDFIGLITGKYLYNGSQFELHELEYMPYSQTIEDGFKAKLRDVVEGYQNSIITASNFEPINSNRINRIFVRQIFGEGEIILFEKDDYTLCSGYFIEGKYFFMETLDDPKSYNIAKSDDDLIAFNNTLVWDDSISTYENVLGTSGIVISVGLQDKKGVNTSSIYYVYNEEEERPYVLINLNWDLIDVDGDGNKDFILRNYLGQYENAIVLLTEEGIKYLDFSVYDLIFNHVEGYFERKSDGIRFLLREGVFHQMD